MNQKFVTMMKESVPCIPMFIVEELFKQSVILESTIPINSPVFVEASTGQRIFSTKHLENDRTSRPWWKSYKDRAFVHFAKNSLKVLQKQWNVKNPNMTFKEFDEVAFVIYKENIKWQAVIASLRKNLDLRTMTSYAMVTVLNKEAPDMDKNYKLNINIKSGNEFIINRYIPPEEETSLQDTKIKLDTQINELTFEQELAKLELEEITDEKEKKLKKKAILELEQSINFFTRKLRRIEQDLKTLTMQESLTTFVDVVTGKRIHVYLIDEKDYNVYQCT